MLAERIETEMKDALRSKDTVRLNTLRMLKSAIVYHLLERGGKEQPATDADVIAVVQKQVKQRRDSIESYDKGGRADLAAKEKAELAILEAYLPKQLTPEELLALVQSTIAEVGAVSKVQTGAVMKALMPKVAGRAGGKQVNQLVLQNLREGLAPPAAHGGELGQERAHPDESG
jgi:hypothetical protein